ncbi:hypothetical protein COCNU_03G003370 [Cocos nucifera]|uniref:Uncharacterized protein n=1 Tax=Cocos nucifera TaxID=13894 RepID=A0A8K0I1W6_COCNU|nr:hypothetical protein COCNU_03G003370 [Cocos nucifera]
MSYWSEASVSSQTFGIVSWEEPLVGQALGITTACSKHRLDAPCVSEVLDVPKLQNILIGPRVGIGFALPEHVGTRWRFAIAGGPLQVPQGALSSRHGGKRQQRKFHCFLPLLWHVSYLEAMSRLEAC